MTRASRRLLARDVVCALALAAVIAAIWCLAYGRTSVESWTTPVSYRGDALFLTAYLKAARDGHVFPGGSLTVPELNAPYGANWNDHPRTLRPMFLAAGLLSRVSGLFFALNLLLFLAHVLAGLSFYAVARYFRARPEWAAAGGLAFGLSHYLFWRSLDHLDLALAWHLPLCILVVSWGFSRRGIPFRSRRFVASAVITAVTAVHNPYYSSLYVQFLLLAALAQALRSRARGRSRGLLVLASLVVAVFLLDNAGSLAYQWTNGLNPGASRPYGNLERFALKPLELLIPPPGSGLGGWGSLARVHWDGRLYRGDEGGSPYQGLVGVVALLWLGALTLAGALGRPRRPLVPAAAAIAWILAYSMLGGINQLIGIFGFVWLRGSNRFSVWILAVALLFLVTRRLPRGRGGLVAAGAVAALAVADQVPRPVSRAEVARTRWSVATDRQFVAAIEAALPPDSMLFTMPLIEFPEGRPVLRAEEYEHLRPYLFSRRLRFSFGTDRGRPRESWQLDVAALPPARMVQALETCGFAAILLNRKGYVSAARDLLDELGAAGRHVTVAHPAGDYVMVALNPRADPVLPRAAAVLPGDRVASVCGQTVPAVSGQASAAP